MDRAARMLGRDDAIALVDHVGERALDGRGGMLLVLGPAGIGKSALVRHTVGASPHAIVGRATPPPAPTAQPLAELALALMRRGADPRSDTLALHRGALRLLLPGAGLGAGVTEQPSPMHVVDGLLELHGQLGARRPDTLVVEDLHWADPFTRQAIDYLAGRLSGTSVRAVVTSRPTDEVEALAERLERRHATELLRLGPLNADDVAAMARMCLRTEPSPAVLELLEVADGVPLQIEELLAAIERDGLRPGTVPRTLLDDASARLDQLGPAHRRVVEAAALLGRAFDPTLLRLALRTTAEVIDDGLRAGAAAGILRPRPDSLRLWFAHDLVRDAVAASIGSARGAALASALSEALAGRDGLDDLERAAELSAIAGDAARSTSIYGRIGDWYLDRALPEAAVERYDAALAVISRAADALPVRERLVQALALTGDASRARREAAAVAALLAVAGTEPRRLEVCVVAAARAAVNAAAWEDAWSLLSEPLGAPDPSPAAAAIGALVALERGEHDMARRLAEDVIAGEGAPPADRCQAAEVLGRLARQHDLDLAQQWFTRAVAIAELADLDLWAARAAHELATIAQLRTLDIDGHVVARDRALRASAPGLVAAIDFHLAALHGVRFEPEPALDAGRRFLDVAIRLGATRQQAWAWNLIGQAHAAAGDRPRAQAAATEALGLAGDDDEIAAIAIGTARGLASLLADDRDRGIEEQCDAIAHLRRLPGRVPLPPWYLWPLLATVYDLEGDGGATARGEGDDPALRVTTGIDGLWWLAEAVARGHAGDRAGADAAARTAQERFDAVPAFAGYVHLGRRFAAEAAIADGWGEPAAWLVAASEWAASRGHDGLRAACTTLGRKAGVPQRRRRRGAAEVPDRLAVLGVTSREVDVLHLVADGLTNAEIAERLYLSPRTIKGYVENLLAKTGAANRTQLAAHDDR